MRRSRASLAKSSEPSARKWSRLGLASSVEPPARWNSTLVVNESVPLRKVWWGGRITVPPPARGAEDRLATRLRPQGVRATHGDSALRGCCPRTWPRLYVPLRSEPYNRVHGDEETQGTTFERDRTGGALPEVVER